MRQAGAENGNRLQHSGLENPLERGAWQATVHGVPELDTTERLRTAQHSKIRLYHGGSESVFT